MEDWISFVETLAPGPDGASLTTKQVQAIIDVLCLVVYAENRCSALEAEEFKRALLATGTFSQFEHIVSSQLNISSGPARHATDDARRTLAEKAAETLNGSGLTTPVFTLASTLMRSKFNGHRQAPQVLATVKDAFGL